MSRSHSTFTDFALVREGLMEAGHPTGGARLSALDRIEEQLETVQRERDEWRARADTEGGNWWDEFTRAERLQSRIDAVLAMEGVVEGLPPELVRVLRDPTITIDRDHEIRLVDGRTLFEHLHEWRNAPSNTASADPYPAREPDPTEGLPLELVRVLRDPTITISRDHEIRLADGRTLFEHIEEWRNAPSDTASASLPAMSQDDAWEKRSHER